MVCGSVFFHHRLLIISRQHSLRIRDDTQRILAKQNNSDITNSKRFAKMNSNIKKQDGDHAELLSHSKTIVTGINAMQASSDHHHEVLISLATQQTKLTNRGRRCINYTNSLIAQKTKQTNSKLNRLSSQVKHTSKLTQQRIDTITAEMKGVHTKTAFMASSIDTITRIVREEILTSLTPLVEQGFNKRELHREAELQRLRNLNDMIAHDIGSNIYARQTVGATASDKFHNTYSEKPRVSQKNERPRQTIRDPRSTDELAIDRDSTALHYTDSTYKSRWYHKSSLGNIKVEVQHTHHRIDGSPQSKSYTSIEIQFLPAQKLLNLPGTSILYSTAPSSNGYHQLAPMIATHPIIDRYHPVFSVIRSGDLSALQLMLGTGRVHLRSCKSDGSTLLHVCILDFY
jgi:hypothetical protein